MTEAPNQSTRQEIDDRIDRCCNHLQIAKLTTDPIEREESIAIAAVLLRVIVKSTTGETNS